MRHLLTIILGSVIAIIIFMTVDWRNFDLSLPDLSFANITSDEQKKQVATSEEQWESGEDPLLWLDTVMFAKGHAFAYSGDIAMWGGWYFDTIYVGNDQMLSYDSVGPSTLKLSLVTRTMLVDLGDPEASQKIKDFMNPIERFKRFEKRYDRCLDSVVDEEYGVIKYMGAVTFIVDYPDSDNKNADKINRFVCQLINALGNERAQVPALSAFYAGYNPTKSYRPVYTGQESDISALSDFVAHKTFEGWIRGENFGHGSSESVLAIKPHIVNERYVTFSKYEYDREGIGHGMYTATFHTFDLKKEKKLTNKDIFKSKYLNKVKMRLFEVMAKDPRYSRSYGGDLSSAEIEKMIENWQSPNFMLEGTEWEEPEREVKFILPDGALTESGVVFSFQPYEIDCFAAGAYHFIVPYKKLQPYLTPEAKRLIRAGKSR